MKDLIAYGKANPGKLNFSSPGSGTSVHISGEMFKDSAGIDMLHVPYKGSGPSMAAVLGGEVQVLFENISAAVPNVKAGRLRAIAVTSMTRSSALPEVPTLNEAGLPGFEVLAWFGMFAPAATPKDVLRTLNAEFVKALKDPKVAEQMLSSQGGWNEKRQFRVSAMTIALVGGRALYLSAFSAYDSPADIAWLKTVSERWLEDLQRLNR